MVRFGNVRLEKILVVVLVLGLLSSCSFRRKKYENPITKDTEQPDKSLYDKAVQDIEKSRYEIARITLNTLINTYDTSEFIAKAKLAIADSWYREGTSSALAQAEAEYKDFILFYPTLEEAAESQEKVCMIHYKQMEKPDRDFTHALRAEEECRQLLVQFPNSKFAPRGQQRLREIQEVIAEGEYRVGSFYHTKGSYGASTNRLQGMVDHYPLYSKAPEALWKLGASYSIMGPAFREKAGATYARIVREYPLSTLTEGAKKRLQELEIAVPEADAVALARMKYEQENMGEAGFFHPIWGIMKKSPDTFTAAKSGSPAMAPFRPTVPVSVPTPEQLAAAEAAALAVAAGQTDVQAGIVQDSTALDTQKDARMSRQNATTSSQTPSAETPKAEPMKNNQTQKKDNKKK